METSRSIVIAGLDPASYPFSKKMDARGVGERKRRLSSNGYPAHDGRAKAALSLQSRRIFSFREPSCWFESVTLPPARVASSGKNALASKPSHYINLLK
jgi:hypothetical protein